MNFSVPLILSFKGAYFSNNLAKIVPTENSKTKYIINEFSNVLKIRFKVINPSANKITRIILFFILIFKANNKLIDSIVKMLIKSIFLILFNNVSTCST